jgi:HPt (histidine-containing phosphotransfer) domain-containing protein
MPRGMHHVPDDFAGTRRRLKMADAAFDRAAALDRMDGDEELLVELARIFVDDVREQTTRLCAAVAARNAVEVQKSAHALKGAASNFHAGPTVAAALALEKLGRSGSLDDVDAALATLDIELARLVEALTALGGDAA